jgi:hypothetical protein
VRPQKHKNGIRVNGFLKNLKNLSLTTKHDNETTSKPGKEEQWGREKSNWGFNSITYCSSPRALTHHPTSLILVHGWLLVSYLSSFISWVQFITIFFTLGWWPIAFVGHFQELL